MFLLESTKISAGTAVHVTHAIINTQKNPLTTFFQQG